MVQDTSAAPKNFGIKLDNRETLLLTGVTEMERFDELEISVSTCGGQLKVSGTGLKVERLDPERAEVEVRGHIDSLEYTDELPREGGLFARIFR